MQTPTQSVLAHGQSVRIHLQQLLDHLENDTALPDWWRKPAWLTSDLLDHIAPRDILEEYAVYHDCGKPSTRTVDQDGRQHFPGHAQASEAVWLSIGGNPHSARLMGQDMDAHMLKADDIAEFASRPDAITLLVTAVAEVHSNALMFGGIDSDGFKIKAKHLDKKGRQVIALMAPQPQKGL